MRSILLMASFGSMLGGVVARAKLVKIGNSRGIHLAKPLLEVAGLADEF
jgi:hypothetical protein